MRRNWFLVVSTLVQAVPHCWSTNWIPLVHHCLSALIDSLTRDVWCQVPHPSLTTTVKKRWFWIHKHTSPCSRNGWYIPQVYTFELHCSPTCAHSTCCVLHLVNSRVMRHFVPAAPSDLSSQRLNALSHAVGPSYQTTVNLGRGASSSTSACLRCLVSSCFWLCLSLFLPVPARRCCHVCHPRMHVFWCNLNLKIISPGSRTRDV